MGVPNSEVGYTSATTGRGAQEVHKGHVVAPSPPLSKKIFEKNEVSKTSTMYICQAAMAVKCCTVTFRVMTPYTVVVNAHRYF
jgi:hypothetical protein